MEDARRQISLSLLKDEDRIVLDRLREFGDAWIVGGWVRDVLSGFSPELIADIDIATNLTPVEVKAIFPRSIMVGEKLSLIHI